MAIWDQGRISFSKELPFGLNQSRHLMPELEIFLKQAAFDPHQCTGIGVGVGPGSYTGIRIGVSVAQGLAYSWNIPLVGIPSLDGFVPEKDDKPFAAIIDARIGGAYVRKGLKKGTEVIYLSEPEVCALEDLGKWMGDVKDFVTPTSAALKTKLVALYPENVWQWEERHPCMLSFGKSVEAAFLKGESVAAGKLELLYLRKTEAERQRGKG